MIGLSRGPEWFGLNEHEETKAQELFQRVLSEFDRLSRRPLSVMRLQLTPEVTFQRAAALIDYIERLGISDLYTSPILATLPGSTHGYDVVDHARLSPGLGGDEGYELLSACLAERGMGHLLDFVPNHMAIGAENALWMEVLENGPSSIHAHLFDIDWNPVKEQLANRVLVPVLGDQYGAVLERGELRLCFESGAFFVDYFEHRFPVTPRQYEPILRHRLEELTRVLSVPPDGVEGHGAQGGEGASTPPEMPSNALHLQDYLSILHSIANLPGIEASDAKSVEDLAREKEVIKRRLAALCESAPSIRDFIEQNVKELNGRPGEARSFDGLDALLREQIWRLAYWRVAAEEINYRRFFDINALAAIRMEDPRVMAMAHRRIMELVVQRKVTGLRIDHPDGLYNPTDYFVRLQEEAFAAVARRLAAEGALAELLEGEELEARWAPRLRALFVERVRAAQGDVPLDESLRPLYVVAEKILVGDEPLPARWAIHGTTGYDFLNALNGLFVESRNGAAMEELFARFTGQRLRWPEQVYQVRRQTMLDSMSSEVNVLARQLNRITEHDRRTRDFTLNSARRALIEVIASFPVYRTYLRPDVRELDEQDRAAIETAVKRARRRNPALDASIFDFVRELLLGRTDPSLTDEMKRERIEFALKLQQVTSPVMAKSVEDTAFYRYNRLVSLNEVGGDPSRFGLSVEKFHQFIGERAALHPHALSATTTHDTKRSEDVRARIDVLSELPAEWRRRLSTWTRINRKHKRKQRERTGADLEGAHDAPDAPDAPDPNEEYLLYQTLLGVYPFGRLTDEDRRGLVARLQGYMLKAMREAKINSSWVNASEPWESAVMTFIEALLDEGRSPRFLKDFREFHAKVAKAGALNSLSQVALKLMLPGVPDLYQGNELWDFSLVDPDNRRAVDFEQRDRLLAELDRAVTLGRERLALELMEHYEDGRIKLYVTSQLLRLRRALGALFQGGDYLPLTVRGEGERNLIAFGRAERGELPCVAVVAPRFVAGLLERAPDLAGERVWRDTFVEVLFPEGAPLANLFTGRELQRHERDGIRGLLAAELFTGFPVAVVVAGERAAALLRGA